MKISELKRLITEDFDVDSRPLVEKLAFTLNPTLEQFYNALNGNLDFANLRQDVKTFEITVDGSGVPNAETIIRSKLKAIQGIHVINVTGNINPVSSPYIIASFDNGNFTVNSILGLDAGTYSVTAVVY